MKQNFNNYVYNDVLTYFKDVFDGTSPYGGTFSFIITPVSNINI